MNSKPKLRAEALIDLSSGLRGLLYGLTRNGSPFQSCLTCTHFAGPRPASEECDLFKSRPPADVIVYGCPKYDDAEDVPF